MTTSSPDAGPGAAVDGPTRPPAPRPNAAVEGVAWVDGSFVARGEARIALDDPGVLLGHGVFETMRVEAVGAQVPRLLDRHLARLIRSAEIARMKVPVATEDLAHIVDEVVARHRRRFPLLPGTFIRLRLTATAGGMVALTSTTTPVWPATTTLASIDAPLNEHGPLRGAKTISHLDETWCRLEADRLGVGEVVRTNTAGALTEGSSTNLFLVRDGVIRTPSLATGCLPGVTRGLVCELVAVGERDDLAPADLAGADEVFVTSSTRGVHSVSEVDGRPLPAPGRVTERVAAAVRDRLGFGSGA